MYLDQQAEISKESEMYQRHNATMEHREYMEKRLQAESRIGGTLESAAYGATRVVNAEQRGTDLILARMSNLIDFLDSSAQKLEMFNNRLVGTNAQNPANGLAKDHPSNGAMFDIANKLNRLDDLAAIISREVERSQQIG